jgi:hypothetical protein
MIEINLGNVEALVLKDSVLRAKLPDLRAYFDTWFTGHSIPALRTLAARTKIELLQAIRPEHLSVLSEYLGQEVSVRSFDPNAVSNRTCQIQNATDCLDGLGEHAEVVVYRKGDTISITAWR